MSRITLRSLSTAITLLLIAGIALLVWPEPEEPNWDEIDYALGTGSQKLFAMPDDQLVAFSFELEPSDWDQLRHHVIDEEYVPARLSVGKEEIGSVGLRFKGALGNLRQRKNLDPDNLPKLSLKVKFNEYADREFCGLQKLNFHSMHFDASLFRDKLSYRMFREFGIAAPRSSHAYVVLNGRLLGVFAMVEQIDAKFLIGRLPSGSIYKEVWPKVQADNYYESRLKASPPNPDHFRFANFARALMRAKDDELVEVAARYTDLDQLLRWFVVDQAINNWDGPMAWYQTDSGHFWNHNLYWHLDAVSGQFTLIPWDLDRSFETESIFAAVPSFMALDADPKKLYKPRNTIVLRAPTCDPLIRAVALYASEEGRYAKVVNDLLKGPFDLNRLDRDLSRWMVALRPAVALDPFLSGWFSDGTGNWKDAVEKLRATARILHLRMEERARAAQAK